MAAWERQKQKLRYKEPSFSSSLLDSIYLSMDESRATNEQQHQVEDSHLHRKRNAGQVEEDIESLRRAIMIEKWIKNCSTCTATPTPRHFPSNSASSTDSSIFSPADTDSTVSKSTPKSLHKKKNSQTPPLEKLVKILHLPEVKPKRDGKLTSTKSRAQKIYVNLKKVKEPVSPGGRIANFLSSILSPRNLKPNQGMEEWISSVMKPRSVYDTKTSSVMKSRSVYDTKTSSGSCDQ